MDIPVWFVLQPTASYKPELYNLDYIMDFKKQQIVDEKASYENHYETLKSKFMARCSKLKICNSFIDLSGLLFGNIEPIFIDQYHISENGNKLIAQSLANVIINEE